MSFMGVGSGLLKLDMTALYQPWPHLKILIQKVFLTCDNDIDALVHEPLKIQNSHFLHIIKIRSFYRYYLKAREVPKVVT